MKILLATLISVVTLTSFAGKDKPLKEGVITFSMEMESSDPAVQAQMAMMGDMTVTQSFKGDLIKSVQDMGMVKITTVTDYSTKKMVYYTAGMIGNKGAVSDLPEAEEDSEGEKPEVTKTDESEEILGYKCIKYTIESEEATMHFYLTEDITVEREVEFRGRTEDMKGVMLKMVIEMENMTITQTATDFQKKCKEKLSVELPEGYEEVKDVDAFMKQMSQMGG